MIYDIVSNLDHYHDVIPHCHDILTYLANHDITQLDEGQYEINGEKAFLIIQAYDTVPEDEKKWESHQKYLDIQMVLSGHECMGHTHISTLAIDTAYDAEKDYMLYANEPGTGNYLKVQANYFCVFFPHDAHKPGVNQDGQPVKVKKAVIKSMVIE